MSEWPKICEEAPPLYRQVIGQRGGNRSRLVDLKAIWRPIDERIAAHKGIDRGGEAELGGTEIKIRPIVITIRESIVDNQANCRVELGGEGLTRRCELRLNIAQDLLPHLLLELFAVARSRWRRDRCHHRRSRGGTEFLNRVFLLPYLVLHLLHLSLHDLKVAPQLLGRRIRWTGRAGRSLGKGVRRAQTHRANNEPLDNASHAFLLWHILHTPPPHAQTASGTGKA